MTNDMPKSEAQWKAETDAQTLAEADIINKDENRLSAAKSASKRMIEEKELELKGLRKIAERKNQAKKLFNQK